jgi:hypothetical protein
VVPTRHVGELGAGGASVDHLAHPAILDGSIIERASPSSCHCADPTSKKCKGSVSIRGRPGSAGRGMLGRIKVISGLLGIVVRVI